ncbi:MAG: hypothetical protein PF440_06320 [Thiomicrorhabdus sp.]|jgi:hypothetical protein|nr:hypothetical protein [Thiomicrorhabdus sp.]
MRTINFDGQQVVQGDTTQPRAIGTKEASLLDGATCEFGMYSQDKVTEEFKRSITERTADNRFRVYATAAETGALAVGTYLVAVKIANATTTPPFSQQIFYELEVFLKAL